MFDFYDDYDYNSDIEELKAEREIYKRARAQLQRHPNPSDPDYPAEFYDEKEDDELSSSPILVLSSLDLYLRNFWDV